MTITAKQGGGWDDSLVSAYESAAPGWSEPYGGPLGVALEADRQLAELKALRTRTARARAAAINEMLKTHSLADVAKQLGVTRQAIYKTTITIPTPSITW